MIRYNIPFKALVSFLMIASGHSVSQTYTGKQMSGLYTGSGGGTPMAWQGNMEVAGIPPTQFYTLRLRRQGGFTLKLRTVNQGADASRYTMRGRWRMTGDSLYLRYGRRHRQSRVFLILPYDDDKNLETAKRRIFALKDPYLILVKERK